MLRYLASGSLEVCPTCGKGLPQGSTHCPQCGSTIGVGAPSLHLPLGTRLKGGTYTVGKVLGQGGFGITYMGSDVRLQRPVAIKEFFPRGCGRQGTQVILSTPSLRPADFDAMKQRFVQEARVLARFSHPGIVRVYEVFEENGTAYLVMEYLRGKSLRQIMEERGGRLPESEAVAYIVQVCEALEVVHGAGLLHRDIKPDNIVVCEDGRVVLIDFGAAREFAARVTQRHTVLLTPGYAPLEQYSERAERGPYTDIYALAATLYHLLTGEVPVPSPDRRMGVALADVRKLNPQVSEHVARAVMQGLEMQAEHRPQSARAFRDLLQASPVPTGIPSVPKLDESFKAILARLYGLVEKAREAEMLIDHFAIHRLRKDVRQTYTYALEAGNLYLIAGAGDDEVIVDLDSRVYAPDGKVLAEDTLTDNIPVLQFRAPTSGNYKVEVWAYRMKGDEGFYTLVIGHKLTSLAERRVMDVWEGIFERFLALAVVSAVAGLQCLTAELDTVGKHFSRTLVMELEGGYEYIIIAAGDEIHVADLDMVVELPDGRKIEDKAPDNVPQARFRLPRSGWVKVTLIAARMYGEYEKGYYALYVGRQEG